MKGDNRAVSPVIGVILMVAITVILAAVIGGFVLGLGDSLNQAPQAQISISDDAGNSGSVVISHNGGDAMTSSDLVVKYNGGTDINFESNHGSEFAVGQAASFSVGTGEKTVTLVHEPSESVIAETTLTVT